MYRRSPEGEYYAQSRPVGLEPTTSGFGNLRSTNWTKDVFILCDLWRILKISGKNYIFMRLITARNDRIRTCDPLLPKQMRYQTALHSVSSQRMFLWRVYKIFSRTASSSLFPFFLVSFFFRRMKNFTLYLSTAPVVALLWFTVTAGLLIEINRFFPDPLVFSF